MGKPVVYYVRLTQSEGGALMTVGGGGVEITYTRGSESVPEANYRDLFPDLQGTASSQLDLADEGGTVGTSMKTRVSDEIGHHVPRASTVLREYHLFEDGDGNTLAFFWDSGVVCVTNSNIFV